MSCKLDIPERLSSKRAFAEIEADRNRKARLDYDIKRESENMKATGSFDSKYWIKLSEVSDLKIKRSQLSLSILKDEISEETWKENEKAKRLREEEYLHSLEADIFRKQASRIEANPGAEAGIRRGYFMQLCTTSTKELGNTGDERSAKDRAQFRENLIAACNSEDPNPICNELWCPILGHFFPAEDVMRAAHIFPSAEGQIADEIFGRQFDIAEELNDIQNGLMLSSYAEKRLDDGDLVLVPDVSDSASSEEIDAWSASDPKEYKIRIINPDAKGMNFFHPGYRTLRKTWKELDGTKVRFSSDHRPRARYLYWQYCKTMLRYAWKGKGARADKVLMQERGKQFWGTKGAYMKKRMLLAFVEQLGHDHEALMENAMVETEDDNIAESDPSALLLASREIQEGHRRQENEDEEGDSDSEDDS